MLSLKDYILRIIFHAKLNNTFTVHTLRQIFDDMSVDEKLQFENALTNDECIDFAFDCDSVGYVYVDVLDEETISRKSLMRPEPEPEPEPEPVNHPPNLLSPIIDFIKSPFETDK